MSRMIFAIDEFPLDDCCLSISMVNIHIAIYSCMCNWFLDIFKIDNWFLITVFWNTARLYWLLLSLQGEYASRGPGRIQGDGA